MCNGFYCEVTSDDSGTYFTVTDYRPTEANEELVVPGEILGIPVKKVQTQWSNEDDLLLEKTIKSYQGDLNWESISRQFVGKTTQQVADRWNKVLNPELIKCFLVSGLYVKFFAFVNKKLH